MDDLISRQAAIDALFGLRYTPGEWAVKGLSMCVDVLRNMPSVQPEPCEDCVSRKAVIRLLHSGYHSKSMIEEVKELPSVQPDIIRCRDCKYWREHKYSKETKRYIPFCGFNAIYTKADDFCSRAERRTDEQTD